MQKFNRDVYHSNIYNRKIGKFKRGLVNLNNRISIQWNTLQPLKNEVIEINLLTQKYVHNMLWKERLYKNLYTNIHKNSQE